MNRVFGQTTGAFSLADGPGVALTVDSITTAAGPVTVSAVGSMAVVAVMAGGAGSNVVLTTGGDLSVGVVTAAAGTVTLGAAGALTDANGDALNVTAIGLALAAAGGAASEFDPLDTAVSVLAAAGGSGGVGVSNTGLLVIGTVGTLGAVTAAGDIVVETTGALTVATPVASDGGTAMVSGNGAVTVNAPITGTAAAVLGGAGTDTITINVTGGTPLAADGRDAGDVYVVPLAGLLAPVGISDTGATGADVAVVLGTPVADAIAITPQSVVFNGNTAVTYAGLENLSVVAGDGDNYLQVLGTAAGMATVVYGGSGADRLAVTSATNQLTDLAGPLYFDAGAGANALFVSAAGGATPDDVTLTPSTISSAVQGYFISYAATGGNFANGVLLLTGAGNDTVNVQGTLPGFTEVLTGAGDDHVAVGSAAGLLTSLASPLYLDEGTGSNFLYADDAASTTPEAVTLTAGAIKSSLGYAITYAATGGTFGGGVFLVTGSGNDTVAVQGTAPGFAGVFTGAGDDAVIVGGPGGTLTGLAGLLYADAGAGSNLLYASEAGNTLPDAVGVTGGSIVSSALGYSIYYAASGGTFGKGVYLVTGAGDDTVAVQGTAPGFTGVFTGAGNDAVIVGSAAGTLTSLAGALYLDAGTGSNLLYANGTGGTADDAVTLTAGSITSSLGYAISYAATGGTFGKGVFLVTGSGSDTVAVQSTAAGITEVLTGAGDDHVVVTSPASLLNTLGGPLYVDEGQGSNLLFASEAGNAAADAVVLSGSSIMSGTSGFAIFYGASGGTFGGGVYLLTGPAADTVVVQGTAPGFTALLTGAGDDRVIVASAAGTLDTLAGALYLDAGDGANELFVSEAGAAVSDNVTVSASAITSAVLGYSINYTASGGFGGGVHLVTGAGNDTVNVVSSLPNTLLAVSTGDGFDVINVAVSATSGYNLAVNGGAPSGGGTGDVLLVSDVSGGAVLHQHPAAAGAGSVDAHYLNGATSVISYADIEGVALTPGVSQSYVQALIHDILGREATPAELASYQQVLQGPNGRQAVADAILRSPEARTRLVDGWYARYLGRSPAPGEDQTYVNLLLQGRTEEDVLAQFFVAYFAGKDNTAFIQTAYTLLLGHPASAADVTAANSVLTKTGRWGVVWGVENSVEYRSLVVTADYQRFLHRAPTAAELNAWVYSGLDLTTYRVQLLSSSPEFFASGF